MTDPQRRAAHPRPDVLRRLFGVQRAHEGDARHAQRALAATAGRAGPLADPLDRDRRDPGAECGVDLGSAHVLADADDLAVARVQSIEPLGIGIEECIELGARVEKSKLVLQVGNNRRFDPGVAFARRFIQEEMGPILALKAWYCDSTYRYSMTDNLQPIPLQSSAARKPEGDPKADKRRYFLLTHGSHLIDTARFFGTL